MKKIITCIFILLCAVGFIACSSAVEGSPQYWCVRAAIYWFEYDHKDCYAIATHATELTVAIPEEELEDKGAGKYTFKAYQIVVFYEALDGCYRKTYLATIWYDAGSFSNAIGRLAGPSYDIFDESWIIDLDVAELKDTSQSVWYG